MSEPLGLDSEAASRGTMNPHLRAQIAAHTKWAYTPDRTAATASARDAFLGRFEKQVDPEGTMDPRERRKRAENAKKAYFLALSHRAVAARRARARTVG
jgi:hypothetical protein